MKVDSHSNRSSVKPLRCALPDGTIRSFCTYNAIHIPVIEKQFAYFELEVGYSLRNTKTQV
jgi:uncharacterized radical SAM superfamily Fe-S cluster-containing enzyme